MKLEESRFGDRERLSKRTKPEGSLSQHEVDSLTGKRTGRASVDSKAQKPERGAFEAAGTVEDISQVLGDAK